MEEFKSFIMKAIMEEEQDRTKYKAWAEKAREIGMEKAAHILREISYEELTHKAALEKIMHMM